MNIAVLALVCMVFCHVFDDYFLQGCLANLKQKAWWEKNWPDPKYKNDYIAGLACHSLSWSFMISLPLIIIEKGDLGWLWLFFPANAAIHAFIDELKANRLRINLIQDQLCHFNQILLLWGTWLILRSVSA